MVKKYTRGEKVTSSIEKDRDMKLITEFARQGKTIKDLEENVKFTQLLDKNGLDLASLLQFYDQVIKQKMDISSILSLQKELSVQGKSPDEILKGIARSEELLSKGLNMENMASILDTANKFGGFENTMKALKEIQSLNELNQIINETKQYVKLFEDKERELVNKTREMEVKINVMGAYYHTTSILVSKGFDIGTLDSLIKLADTYGGPIELFNAIGTYQSLTLLENKRSELNEILRETQERIDRKMALLRTKEHFIEKATRMIGEIEANQAKALNTQLIYQLLSSPETLTVDPQRFKRTSLHFLVGLKQYIEKNKEKIADIKRIENYLDILIKELTRIV